MSTRAFIIQAQQAVYDEMCMEFEAMGTGGQYCQEWKRQDEICHLTRRVTFCKS